MIKLPKVLSLSRISVQELLQRSDWKCYKTIARKQYTTGSSVSEDELNQFREFATEWWRPGGEYDALRSFNSLRVPTIVKAFSSNGRTARPLLNKNIVDIGCGGGILTEPLARLGGTVIGIDPLSENIESAEAHALNDRNNLSTLQYQCITVEEFAEKQPNEFDMVIASEVVEHVENPTNFIYSCCQLVKPGGHIFISTINRSLISTALVKYATEYLLRVVPVGTHDENKFVTTNELTDMLRKANMHSIRYRGTWMNPLTLQWAWSDSLSMNYICEAKKPK